MAIHPFVNGNGRHSRLVADLLAVTLGRPEFTWGVQDLTAQGDVRRRYVQALKAADAGDLRPAADLRPLLTGPSGSRKSAGCVTGAAGVSGPRDEARSSGHSLPSSMTPCTCTCTCSRPPAAGGMLAREARGEAH